MRASAPLAAIAFSLLTCACGGGGGGSSGGAIASTPPPAVTPSPTPTPAPSTGFTSTVVPTAALPGTTASVKPVGSAGHEEILDAGRLSIGRDAAGNYLITIPVVTGQTAGLSEGFLRRFEFLAANRTITPNGAQQYANGRSGSTFPNEKSALTILPASTAANPLKHVNFGSLTVTLSDTIGFGDPLIPGGNTFVFGERTAVGDTPLTGSASFSGTFATAFATRGFSVSDGGGIPCGDIAGSCGDPIVVAGQLSGDVRLSVNFADRGISGSLVNIADSTGWFSYTTPDLNHRLADLAFAGSLGADGTLSGTFADAPGTPFTGGNWNGSFFGPQAAEVGGSLILRATIFGQPSEYAGYFGGRKN